MSTLNEKIAMSLFAGSGVQNSASDEKTISNSAVQSASQDAAEQRVRHPRFDTSVFDYVADFDLMRNLLAPVVDHPEHYPAASRDLLLMAGLTRLSVIAHALCINYNNRIYSSNIAFLFIARSSWGKATMQYAKAITRGVNAELRILTQQRRREYQQKQLDWELEQAQAKKDRRTPDLALKPGDEPGYNLCDMPATTSKSQLLLALRNNQQYGIMLSSTEIGTLVDALGKDCGQFNDVICKGMMNETIDQYYKVDGDPVIIDFPKLSIELSGVEEHFHRLFHNVTDGGFNRFFCYTVQEESRGFCSQKPDYSNNGYCHEQQRIADEGLALWRFMTLFDRLLVTFTDEQWERHTAFWQQRDSEFHLSFSANEEGIVFRHALGQHRLAAIFTLLELWQQRKAEFMAPGFDAASIGTAIECTPTAFEAAESIVGILFHHALNLATTKVQQPLRGVRKMSNWMWYYDVLAVMNTPDIRRNGFTKDDFLRAARSCPEAHVSRSNMYTLFNVLIQKKELKRARAGRYKFTRQLINELKDYSNQRPEG